MSRQQIHSLLLCVIVAAMCFHVATPDAKAEKLLRWKLKKGDAFEVIMTQDVNEKMNMEGDDFEVTQRVSMYLTWKVVDIDDESVISLSQKLDRVVIELTVPNVGVVRIDTESKEDGEVIAQKMLAVIRPMINAEVTQTMNDRGEILDVKIPDEALAGLKQNKLMKDFFSGDAFKEMMRKAPPALPEQAVTPGFPWKRVSKVKSPAGEMQMTNDFTYEGEVEKDGRKLDKITANIVMEFQDGDDNQLQSTVTVTDQENKGAIYFDANAGHVVESEIEQRMSMKLVVAGKSIDQKIVNTTVMKITPKSGD